VTLEVKAIQRLAGCIQSLDLVLDLVAPDEQIAQRARLVAAASAPGAVVPEAGQATLAYAFARALLQVQFDSVRWHRLGLQIRKSGILRSHHDISCGMANPSGLKLKKRD
jgi:hypothetical protein